MDKTTMVKKADAFEILNHWVLVASFLILAVSGFGFLYHIQGIGSIFGGFPEMRQWHNITGIVFSASLLLTLFSYMPVSLSLSADDLAWIMKAGGYLSHKAVVPPQDKINTGQKIFYLLLFIGGAAIAASGFVIWLLPGEHKWVLVSHLTHNLVFDLFMLMIPAHIYLGTLANPGTLRIMLVGTVPLPWAKRKHAKWVKKMGF